MLKLFKETFKTTNDSIIVAVPLILFMSILGCYLEFALMSVDSTNKFIFAMGTFTVLFCCCISGWFYMVKKALQLTGKIFVFDKDRVKELRNLSLSLFKGVGRLFLPIFGIVLIYLCVYAFLITGIGAFISHYVGTLNLEFLTPDSLFISSWELIDEINDLSRNELIIINLWYIAVIIITVIVSFITFLWIPEVVYAQKNPLKALIISIKKVFKTFKRTLLLFAYVVCLAAAVSILNTLLMFNPFLYFVVLVLSYYFLVYAVVLVFTYYEQEFAQ